jgi:hypothetical protein
MNKKWRGKTSGRSVKNVKRVQGFVIISPMTRHPFIRVQQEVQALFLSLYKSDYMSSQVRHHLK